MTEMDGASATVLIIVGSIVVGALLGIAIMMALHGIKWIQRLALPYYDEMDSVSDKLRASLSSKTKMDIPRAVREGLFAVALGIVLAGTIQGFLEMIGHLATPAG